MLLLLLFLLSGANQASDARGEILVRIEAGVTILLNGEAVGVSSTRDGGLSIRQVRPGRHKLTFQTSGGVAMDTQVEVFAGQVTPVSVSALTLRASARKRKSDVEVRVESDALECVATLGDRRESITSPRSVVFSDAPTGEQRIAVSCGGRTVQKTVTIAAGRAIVVEADFRTKVLRVVEDRTRIKELVVKSSRDLLVDAQIPATAKRALLAAIRPGTDVLGISDRSDGKFVVLLEAESSWTIDEVAGRLQRSGEFKTVETLFVDETERPRRVRKNLILTFGYTPGR